MSKCEHKYNYVKETQVPTGKYIVETKEAYTLKNLEDIPPTENYIREEMTTAGVSVCEKCGDIRVKALKFENKENK